MYYFKSVDTGSIVALEHAHDAKALRDMKGYYEEVAEEDFDLYTSDREKKLNEVAQIEAEAVAVAANNAAAEAEVKAKAEQEANERFANAEAAAQGAVVKAPAKKAPKAAK